MKTLNLVYSDKSDIQYKISQFPDGQQTKDEENAGLLQTVFLNGQLVKEFSLAEIRERLNSY